MGDLTTILWPSHSQQLSEGLWNHLLECFETDFVISVSKGGQTSEQFQVQVHRLILSIFCPALKTLHENVFQLDNHSDMDEVDLRCLLEFIYTGKIDASVKRLNRLKAAGQQLGLVQLVDSIEKCAPEAQQQEEEEEYPEEEDDGSDEKPGSKRKRKKPVKIPRKDATDKSVKEDKRNICESSSEEEEFVPTICRTRSSTSNAKKKKPVLNRRKMFRLASSSGTRNPESSSYESSYFNAVSQTCLLCDKKFKSKQIFRQHVRCHRDPNIMRQCPHCPAKIYSKTNLSNHIAWKHQRDLDGNLLEKKFKCDECEFICVAEFQLKSHKGYKHGIKSQKCDQCSYSCRTHADLVKHKDGVHGQLRPFMCDTCGFCTKTRSSFRLHLTIHQEKIPCDICGVHFKYRALSRHKLNAHCENKKAFPCHMCSYATKCKSYLKVHLTKVHKVDSTSAEVAPPRSTEAVAQPSSIVNPNLYYGVVGGNLQFDHASSVFCDL